jgi:hypothetical protein
MSASAAELRSCLRSLPTVRLTHVLVVDEVGSLTYVNNAAR